MNCAPKTGLPALQDGAGNVHRPFGPSAVAFEGVNIPHDDLDIAVPGGFCGFADVRREGLLVEDVRHPDEVGGGLAGVDDRGVFDREIIDSKK